uniref:NADPH--cytochrome P450 reductase n=1 Tax=Cunninghamella elegans TaxID=4853 RepID=Q9P4E2_CUNEL|nr:NADPH-dependent cytochrome P450 oxidoreductase [Cunninghamella elegans]
MAQQTPAVIDTLDLILLGSIGLGTIAWFTRRQLSERLFGTGQSNATPKPTTPQAPKRERNFVKVMEQQGRKVIFFYGSQTGTAEDFASRLAKQCSQKYGVSCMTADIEMYDLSYLDTLSEDSLVCFVMATYGEGEPTDNAVDFWEQFITDESPVFSEGGETLENLRYLMFGLGNKTYEHYNAVARILDKKLTGLGAKRIGERGEGDDDGSLEEDFLAWQESMWPTFCDALGVDENNAQQGPRQASYSVDELKEEYKNDDVYFGELGTKSKDSSRVVYDAKRPYNAPITTRELFNSSERHCLHVDIDISGTNLSYQTGDHVAMWPTNNEDEVLRLANILGLQDKLDNVISVKAIDPAAPKQHPFPVPTTYRAIFRHYIDICAPASRQSLMSFVEFAPTDSAKDLLKLLATDKDEYRLKVGEAVRNLGEVLELVSGNDKDTQPGSFTSVPFDLIVETIPRLQPRYYSISSSSKENSSIISATCVTLAYQPDPTPDRTVYGVNTNFLYRIHTQSSDNDIQGLPKYDLAGPRKAFLNEQGQSHKLPIHIRRSQFKLPRNTSCPVIMIGPGTGVAPFRGFVRERALQKKEGKSVGPTVLFFGNRHSEHDFLYSDEWPELFNTLGDDSKLITAFSRETEHKVYVQHRLEENGKDIWQLLEKGAYIYVCGDARNMARDVNQTFVNLAMEYGEKTEQKALDYVKSLRNTGRYQEDVWS